jgi:ribosomal-protein-alanine N-acetyltransferase
MLRHFVPDDLEALYALYRDPEMRQYYPDGTRTRDETKQELEWFLNGHPHHPELGLWATIDRSTGQFLGRCGLLPWQIGGQAEVEVAFMIAKPRWGQGLATEAADAIVRHGQDVLGLRRLVCLIMPGNAASEAVARKIGMSFERHHTDEIGPCSLFSVAVPPK